MAHPNPYAPDPSMRAYQHTFRDVMAALWRIFDDAFDHPDDDPSAETIDTDTGRYTITLRRWPKRSVVTLIDQTPETTGDG